jgi:hypothetical protein
MTIAIMAIAMMMAMRVMVPASPIREGDRHCGRRPPADARIARSGPG